MPIIGLTGQYNYRGIPLANAFARIDVVTSREDSCIASVNIYATKEVYESGDGYLDQLYPVSYTKERGINVGDDHTQGYNFVKGLELFSGWTFVTN